MTAATMHVSLDAPEQALRQGRRGTVPPPSPGPVARAESFGGSDHHLGVVICRRTLRQMHTPLHVQCHSQPTNHP